MAGTQERFGERLRHYREAAGFSQEQLAELAGLSANAISALERGERKRPYPDTLRRLAEALGLSGEARADLAAAASRAPREAAPAPVSDTGRPPRLMTDLPGEVTPLIGREREADVVRHLLAHAEGRLLTLTGPGGVGKTRLALHVARTVRDDYPGGVVWVELAPLGEPELVLSTIARAIGLQESLSGEPAEVLYAHLRGRQALLVLDNFEHLLGAANDVAELLRACPELVLLVTSRAPLNIRGEQEYTVPPLELPPSGRVREMAAIAAVPSVQLFVWQARQRDPAFALTEENAPAVAVICRRLDGVPLALELAAARVKLLGTAELLARLDRALPILTGGARDLPARQRTMEAAIRWSYDLLCPSDQALFRRLAVFAGGWTLEAAEAVVNAAGDLDIDVVDSMAVLVDQSLVRQGEGRDATRRFTMLETFREFGLKRLEDAGEAALVRRAHLEWCLTLAEAAETGLAGPEQPTWLARLEAEHDNLRAALGSSLGGADEERLRLAGALWRFWWWHGHFTEGRAWLDQLLARGDGAVSTGRGKALVAAGILARAQGDFAHARALLEEGLAIRRQLGERRGVAQALNILGLVASDQSDYARALELHEEGLQIYRELGDRLGIGNVLNNLGIVAREQGDFDRASELYAESLRLFREVGEMRGITTALHNLGRVAFDQGKLDRAVELYQESLAVRRELGDEVGAAMTLHNLGNVVAAQGDIGRAIELYQESLVIRADFGDKSALARSLEDLAVFAASLHDAAQAVRLYAAAMALRDALGAPVPPADRHRYERIVPWARSALGADAVEESLATGRGMSTDEAVEDALAFLRQAALRASAGGTAVARE